MILDISLTDNAVLACPYDDVGVIAGNGVGALEIVEHLNRERRIMGCLICPVSGGGLVAGLPSGAISVAELLTHGAHQSCDGDPVAITSGRKIDDDCFSECLHLAGHPALNG